MTTKKNFESHLNYLKKNGVKVIVVEPKTLEKNIHSCGISLTYATTANEVMVVGQPRPQRPKDLKIETNLLNKDIYNLVNYKMYEVKEYKLAIKRYKQFKLSKGVQSIIDKVFNND